MPHVGRAFAQFDRTWAYASTIPSGTGTVNMFPGASDVSFYRPSGKGSLTRKAVAAPAKATAMARAMGAKARRLRITGGTPVAMVPPAPQGSGVAPVSPASAAAAAGAPAGAVAAVGSTPAGAQAAAAANGGAAVVKTPPELKGGFLGLPSWAVWGAVGVVGFVLVRGLVK